MLDKEIIAKIEEKHGRKILYSYDCDALAQQIADVTGERLSVATLKRMLGFTSQIVIPRKSSLDILARFLGYSDYASMQPAIGRDSFISDFAHIEEVVADNLESGAILKIAYQPDRVLTLEYIGSNNFVILEAYNTKLQVRDILTISHFAIGFQLLISEVVRDGKKLGSYIAAKSGGLTSIEIVD